ncbi:MAG: DNA polymerase III subunit epsilon [Flavobacteriaceae bacterium]|nr:DNA polymerase III subunit epsilon [Flavobacteriaceae bacterium]
MKTVYLDTETTGLSAEDEIVELTIIDDNEEVLINTLMKPINHTHWPGAERVHGISTMDVRNAPTQKQISDKIREVVKDTRVVIYNAPYDSQYLPELEEAAEVRCAMREFADFNKSKWINLGNATKIVGYEWEGAHRALADTKALRAVWKFLQKE